MLRGVCLVLCTAGVLSALSATDANFTREPRLFEGVSFDDEPDLALSMLETETTAVLDRCYSVGDTHVGTFAGTNPRHFNVMGFREWIIVEGPDATPNIPKFWMQGIQRVWQNCGRSNPHVTILKEIAWQCGSFYFLMNSPIYTSGCASYGLNLGQVIEPGLYVKGVNRATNRVYDGRDYLKDPDFRQGQTVEFNDGTGTVGKVQMSTNLCGGQTCTGHTNGQRMVVVFECAGTRNTVYMHGGSGGWSYIDAYMDIPKDTPGAKIQVGSANNRNLNGGYCGGWSNARAGTLNQRLAECVRLSPQHFYKQLGQTTPCIDAFTTTAQNSLFAAFEHWSKGTPRPYDSPRDADEAAQAAAGVTGFDQQKWDEGMGICRQLAGKVSNVPYKEKPTNPKELNIKEQIGDCTEDSYFGMQWDQETMRQEICDIVAFKIEQERKDVYCAAKMLDADCDSVRLSLDFIGKLEVAKTATETDQLRQTTGKVAELSLEVESSSDNILYWYQENCDTLIPDTEELEETNCQGWVFKDTQTDMSEESFKSRFRHLQPGILLSVDRQGQEINFDDGIEDPIVFLGAPTFEGPNPAVPRMRVEHDKAFVFLQQSKCQDQTFAKEQVPFLVMDEKYNYGDHFVIKSLELNPNSWTTVNWGKTLPAVPKVFATIQTANNHACSTCGGVEAGANGYMVVQVRNVGTTSVQVRLLPDRKSQVDGTALEKERVGILAVLQGEGEVKDLKYKSGQLTTSHTHSDARGPTTVQSLTVGEYAKVPVILTQVTSVNDERPVSLRSQELMVAYKFKVDEDGCDGARDHTNEKVDWFSLQRSN